jgi:hypothetical protein
MRIVTGKAVANRRRVHRSLYVSRFLIRMTGEAERGWRGGDQLHPRDIFIDPYLVAGRTPHGHGRVDRLSLGLVHMALKAFRGFGFRVKRNGMNSCIASRGRDQNQQRDNKPQVSTEFTDVCASGRFREPGMGGELLHTDSEGSILHEFRGIANDGMVVQPAQAIE